MGRIRCQYGHGAATRRRCSAVAGTVVVVVVSAVMGVTLHRIAADNSQRNLPTVVRV